MSRPSLAFPRSYQRHLVTEQRKAVLAALRDRIGPEHTVGEVLDAAEALGWAEPMGELSLADLAEALLTPLNAASPAALALEDDPADDEVAEDDEPDDDDEAEAEAPAPRGRGSKKKAAKKAATAKVTKAPARKTSAKASPPAGKKGAGKKGAGKKAAKKAAKAAPVTTSRGKARGAVSKKTGKNRRPAKVDFDEPMSLEEAAGVLVPLVKSLGEATMQDLEEQTAGGRRKLRFHIGQLVRHGYLLRHGMGRGTFYTVG